MQYISGGFPLRFFNVQDQCGKSKAVVQGIPATSPGGSRKSCPCIMGPPTVGN